MEIYQKLLSAIENKEGVALITITKVVNRKAGDHHDSYLLGSKLLVWSDGRLFSHCELPTQLRGHILQDALQALESRDSHTSIAGFDGCEIEYYIEIYAPPLHLIVAGAGHVAKPVVQMGKILGFNITVICDRPEFANKTQFPWADEVICKPYLDYFRALTDFNDTYILLLTRGHRFDVMILRELLTRQADYPYIGMIGSRRRISGVFSQLREDFPEETFSNIYAPVGLDIGAQTPEEIAVSVLGEIIKVKNNRTGKSLRDSVRYYLIEEKGKKHE
jgi:xanthine dehydrogenase accessory factor